MKPPGSFSIAIVDDDESLCRSLGRLLRVAGMNPESYLSAESFLGNEAHAAFDCLVLDVQLGGISGIELQRKLAETGVRTPIVFITAYDEPEAREQALAVGCIGYFRKNDAGSDVIEAIRRAVANGTS